MTRTWIAVALLAVGQSAPLFLRSNYDMDVPEPTVAQTVSSDEANAAIAGQTADVTLGVTVNHLSAFRAVNSDFVQTAGDSASLFLPFVADGAEIKSDASAITVKDAEELEARYAEGATSFLLHTNCLKHAESVAKTLESLATQDNKRALSFVAESPETAAFRRRLQDEEEEATDEEEETDFEEENGINDDGLYVIGMTPDILAALLLGLFLLTTSYCGFTIMMDVEVPLRTRAKVLPIRKEF